MERGFILAYKVIKNEWVDKTSRFYFLFKACFLKTIHSRLGDREQKVSLKREDEILGFPGLLVFRAFLIVFFVKAVRGLTISSIFTGFSRDFCGGFRIFCKF